MDENNNNQNLKISNPQRVLWIDALRFLGIIAIYVGHLGECTGRLYAFVWTYHVPLMFFVSGLVFRPDGSFLEYLGLSFKRIMIPYYFFMLLNLSFSILTNPISVKGAAVMLVKGLLAVKGIDFAQPLWFLPALFLIQCVLFLLFRTLRRKGLVLLLAFALYYLRTGILADFSSLLIPYCADYALAYLIYFALGAVASLYVRSIRFPCRPSSLVALLTVGAVGYAYVYFCGYDPLSLLQVDSVFSAVIGFFRVVLLIAANIAAALPLSRVKCILRVGQATLYMVGNEILVKTVVPTALALVGLSCNPVGELSAIIYCTALLFLTERFIIPIEEPLLQWIQLGKRSA